MNESKRLLENTIRHYQNLLEHVNQFKSDIERKNLSTSEIEKCSDRLKELQLKVEASDRDFFEYFKRKSDTLIEDTILMQKRLDMMHEIMEVHDFLLPRLASLMNVTRNELGNLKRSMRQVNGYHSGSKPTSGKIIRSKG